MLVKKRKRRNYEETSENEGPSFKKKQLFSGISFRKAVQGDGAIEALKEFVNLCKSEDTHNVVLEYLEAGGGALEILGLLQSDQKKNMAIVVPVFSALQFIIMCTVTDAQKYRPSTEEACKHLLNYYLSTVHDMLSLKSTAKHRQIVLKLLAAMVTLSPRLAQMILNHVKIGPSLWTVLIKHTKPINKSVRTTYIHFLMAFLFDGCVSVIRPLLEMKGFLSSIIPGLLYDSAETVHMVLTTLQNKILMNMSISKTAKLHTFSTPVVKSLLALYNWKGPSKWKPTLKEREESKAVIEEETEETKEDKEIVVDAVHEFLQILCTSHKYGIIFHDKSIGTSGKKHNELLQTVLDGFEKPWEDDKTSELVLKIIAACPDLTKCILSNVEPFLEPRVSVKWVKTVHFVKQLIKNMDPERCLKPYLGGLTVQQITNVIQTLTTPPVILRALASEMLQHRQLVIRHEALSLTLVMLQQFHSFMATIKQWKVIEPYAERTFKQSIMKQLPSTEMLLSLWKSLLSSPDESENDDDDLQSSAFVEEPALSSHILEFIDLLLIYDKCFPQVLDIPSSINLLADVENILVNEDDIEAIAVVQERILKLMISLDSFAFTPDKDMFGDAISRLSHLIDYPSSTIPLQARNILCTLFINTGIFEGILSEVLVWLHCYLTVPTEHKKSVVKLLVESIVKVSENPTKYVDYILQAEEATGEDNRNLLETSRDQDIFDELLEDIEEEHVDDNETPLPVSAVTLSPLLPGVLETATANVEDLEEVKQFLSYVIIHLFHFQPLQSVLPHLLQKWSNLVPSSVTNYINGWFSDSTPKPLKKQFGSHSLEGKLSKTLLSEDGNDSVNHILGLVEEGIGNNITESNPLNLDNLKTNDPIHILLLYKLSLHHMVQLASRGEFTEKLRDKCKDALFSFLQMVSELDKRQQDDTNAALTKELFNLIREKDMRLLCLKYTLTHPFLLQKFTPISRKKQVIEKLMTVLILDLLKLSSVSRKDVQELHVFLKPFKHKLMNCILKRIKKCQKNKIPWLSVEDIVSVVDLFELDFSDITNLLNYLVKVPKEGLICNTNDSQTLSVWGSLLVHLLDRCIKMHKPLKPGIVSSIINQLTLLAKQEKLDISPLEDSFCQYLECFPHHIEHITPKLLIALLNQEGNPSCARLGVLILSRKTLFIHDFISQLRQNKSLRQKAVLIFPLLSAVLTKGTTIDQALLNKIYLEHEALIQKSVLKPSKSPKWLKENMTAVSHLINKCMGTETCHKLYEDLKSRGTKLIKYEDFYIDLLKCVFMKALKNQGDGDYMTDLVLIFMDMLINLSKEDEMNEKQMKYICENLQSIVTSDVGKCVKWAEMKNTPSWSNYIKMSLKFGLQPSIDTDGILLDTLSKMCNGFSQNDENLEQVNQIFQWTLSHSEFLNIILGSSQKKCKLVELLLVLSEKNSSVMLTTHIPVLLSSYNATLSATDKLILKLLQLYESKGVTLHECRPYLWGEAAVNHYSVRTNIGMSLWRQPHASHVLELLNKDCVLETISKYPLNRGLQDSQSSSTICDDTIYDPAFYLPLFSHLLAPESVIQAHKFVVSGGFALTVAALASTCADVRAAAYLVLARLYFHTEAIRSEKGRMLGLQFLDAIRNGVCALKNKSDNPQLSCIITTFLARASLILTETHHTMYVSLQNFIIAKSSLDMNTVPEFFTFFHSSEVEYRVFRQWILQVICDGLKSELDFQLSERCVVFKLLLGFYSSVLCDNSTKNLILAVLESAVKIQIPAELLVTKNGLISWLYKTIKDIKQDDADLIHSAINVLFALWNSFCTSSEMSRKKLTAIINFPQHILLLSLKLLSGCGMAKLPLPDLKKLLQTLNGVISFVNTKAICSLISPNDMNVIINFAKDSCESISDCEDLLLYGCKYAKSIEDCKPGTDNEQALLHLRSLVVKWLQKMYNGQAPC